MSSNQLSSTSVLGVISTCSTSSSWFGGFTRTDLSISRIVIIIVRYLRSSYIHHDHFKKTWFSSDIYFIVRKSCNSSNERMNSDGAKSNTENAPVSNYMPVSSFTRRRSGWESLRELSSNSDTVRFPFFHPLPQSDEGVGGRRATRNPDDQLIRERAGCGRTRGQGAALQVSKKRTGWLGFPWGDRSTHSGMKVGIFRKYIYFRTATLLGLDIFMSARAKCSFINPQNHPHYQRRR